MSIETSPSCSTLPSLGRLLARLGDHTHNCTTVFSHVPRFAVLSEQCDQWVGAIAAVLYVPIVHGTVYAVSVKYHNKPLSVVLDAVKDIHASLIARGILCACLCVHGGVLMCWLYMYSICLIQTHSQHS